MTGMEDGGPIEERKGMGQCERENNETGDPCCLDRQGRRNIVILRFLSSTFGLPQSPFERCVVRFLRYGLIRTSDREVLRFAGVSA